MPADGSSACFSTSRTSTSTTSSASLRSGDYLVGVTIEDADRETQRAVDALRPAGAEFINVYDGNYIESFD